MMRKANEALGETGERSDGGEIKRKCRGPYKKWTREIGSAMPRSTRHSRENKTERKPKATMKCRAVRACRRSGLSEQDQAPTSQCLKNRAINAAPNPVIDNANNEIPEHQSEECSNHQQVTGDDDDQEQHQVRESGGEETHLEVLQQSDDQAGEQPEASTEQDDVFPDGQPDEVFSEDSFILRLVEECLDTLEEPTTNLDENMPTPDSDSDDEEELIAIAPDLNLTSDEKVQLLLLMATKNRHNLTYTAAEDIMELAGILTGSEKCNQATKHIIKSVINAYSCDLSEHHICAVCGKYIGIVLTPTFECTSCNNVFNTTENKKKGHLFLYLSLRQQLEEILTECAEFIVNTTEREKICKYNYEDIYDGQVYKKKIKNNVLSFNFFVDGLQVSSTSKRSAWPVLACINELPLKIRRRYILMACLWLSLKKPNCHEYLKPFVEECIDLARTGIAIVINGRPRHFEVKPCMCVCDTIARPLLRNSTQFNGGYGCGLCLHPGIELPYGRGHVRSYSTRNNVVYPMRTHEDIMMYARAAEARADKEPVMGIKGVSILSRLPDFDMARCLDLDIFHALVNVAKRFANLWFQKKFRKQKFSISKKIDEVNSKLNKVTPTSDVSRAPRSMSDRSDFRGHEWFHWVIDYSIPVLKNILPSKYLNHWSLLVHGIALMMQNSVAKSEVEYASRYISDFVASIDQLYGAAHVTISAHLLTHLGASIKDFGQPWSHSAFNFESYNADIKQAVKSSNGASQQICKSVQLRIALRLLEKEVGENMNAAQVKYMKKMKSGQRLADPFLPIGPVALLGKPKSSGIPRDFMQAMRRAGCREPESSFLLFDRCQLHGNTYHSRHYSKVTRQNNSVILQDSGDILIIESFVVVQSSECFVLGFSLQLDRQKKLCDQVLPHIKILKEEPQQPLKCFPVTSIHEKLLSFMMEWSPSEYVRIACVNVLEMEMLR